MWKICEAVLLTSAAEDETTEDGYRTAGEPKFTSKCELDYDHISYRQVNFLCAASDHCQLSFFKHRFLPLVLSMFYSGDVTFLFDAALERPDDL